MPLWGREKRSNIVRDARLVGMWDLDPSDTVALARYGSSTMILGEDGRLTHVIHAPEKDMIMLLTWRTEGQTIITNQPSVPREEKTSYTLLDDHTLLLTLAGETSRYVRRNPLPR